MKNTMEILKKLRGSQERERKVMMHNEKVYSCNLCVDSREGEYFCGVKGKVRSLLYQIY